MLNNLYFPTYNDFKIIHLNIWSYKRFIDEILPLLQFNYLVLMEAQLGNDSDTLHVYSSDHTMALITTVLLFTQITGYRCPAPSCCLMAWLQAFPWPLIELARHVRYQQLTAAHLSSLVHRGCSFYCDKQFDSVNNIFCGDINYNILSVSPNSSQDKSRCNI